MLTLRKSYVFLLYILESEVQRDRLFMSQKVLQPGALKRKLSDENQEQNCNMDAEAKKPKANFSAILTTNGLKVSGSTAKLAVTPGSVKKIVIKSMKEPPRLPENYLVCLFLYTFYPTAE